MRNLSRALRIALRYKYSLAGSIFCSIMVALLWGTNISAIYPFVELGFSNKPPVEWARAKQAEQLANIATVDKEIAQIAAGREKRQKQEERAGYESRLARARWFEDFADRHLPHDTFRMVALVMGVVLVATVLKGLFLIANTLLVARIGQRTILDIQNMFFAKALDMELSAINETGTGDLAGRIRGETGTIGAAVGTLLGTTLREPLKMLACLIGAALVNWRLLIFSMIVCPFAILVLMALARGTKRATQRAMEESAKLMNRLFQALTYLKVVKIFTRENHERRSFRRRAQAVYKRVMRIRWYSGLYRLTSEVLGVAVICLAAIAGGYLVLRGETTLFGIRMCAEPMTAGGMTMFFGFLIGAADPIRKLAGVYSQILSGVVAAGRVFPLIDRQPAIASPPSPKRINPAASSITLENVWFGYRTDDPILRGIDLHIEAGETIAILGPNGSGKSTLANLLPRFYDAQKGRVLIDGVDVREYRLKDLRRHIGMVTQRTMLFNDSVMDNIRYGNSRASEADAVAAARRAQAHEFITNQLEDGYDTIVGEHAGRLSGGQAQRLSLARTILRDPHVLILDEATSQIDPKSEVLLGRALAGFTRDRTTIMITHRLSTLDLADRIVLMDEGQIVDVGRHDELLKRCDLYSRLRRDQLRESA